MEDETIAIRILSPVLPILTPGEIEIPFGSCEQMFAYNKSRQLGLAELAIEYESARGGIGRDEIIDKMVDIVRTMKNSVRIGLAETCYKDRILVRNLQPSLQKWRGARRSVGPGPAWLLPLSGHSWGGRRKLL